MRDFPWGDVDECRRRYANILYGSQRHTECGPYCLRNARCRFGFPKKRDESMRLEPHPLTATPTDDPNDYQVIVTPPNASPREDGDEGQGPCDRLDRQQKIVAHTRDNRVVTFQPYFSNSTISPACPDYCRSQLSRGRETCTTGGWASRGRRQSPPMAERGATWWRSGVHGRNRKGGFRGSGCLTGSPRVILMPSGVADADQSAGATTILVRSSPTMRTTLTSCTGTCPTLRKMTTSCAAGATGVMVCSWTGHSTTGVRGAGVQEGASSWVLEQAAAPVLRPSDDAAAGGVGDSGPNLNEQQALATIHSGLRIGVQNRRRGDLGEISETTRRDLQQKMRGHAYSMAFRRSTYRHGARAPPPHLWRVDDHLGQEGLPDDRQQEGGGYQQCQGRGEGPGRARGRAHQEEWEWMQLGPMGQRRGFVAMDVRAAMQQAAVRHEPVSFTADVRELQLPTSAEDNVYPKGASVQFYKLFLDETIRDSLRRFQAIAILEWDVIVADDNSFDMMHRAAFDGLDEYWVKGASLAGVNFHETALLWHQWCILGHINGNAIYSNSDPAFVEFLEFTLARWEYAYSYDVALWATIADFPYSWPLWQRFSSKFVSSKLIANMGFEDVSESTIRKAVDSGTMFIHGNRASGGSEQYHQNEGGPHHVTPLGGSVNCTVECGSESSTVCDDTCLAAEHDQDDYRRLLCGAGDVPRYGPHCRQCFTEADEAAIASRANDGSDEHVIMCHTKRPPPSGNCSMECAENAQTLCAFTLGHLTFLDETMAGVRSLAHFMPGVQVVVGVDPENNSAFRSYGADIIMPSWLNYQLRRILLPDTVGVKLVLGRVDPPEQMVAISHVQAIDDAYVPESTISPPAVPLESVASVSASP
eukprot:g12266.t1